jgi:hypothetical protein
MGQLTAATTAATSSTTTSSTEEEEAAANAEQQQQQQQIMDDLKRYELEQVLLTLEQHTRSIFAMADAAEKRSGGGDANGDRQHQHQFGRSSSADSSEGGALNDTLDGTWEYDSNSNHRHHQDDQQDEGNVDLLGASLGAPPDQAGLQLQRHGESKPALPGISDQKIEGLAEQIGLGFKVVRAAFDERFDGVLNS